MPAEAHLGNIFWWSVTWRSELVPRWPAHDTTHPISDVTDVLRRDGWAYEPLSYTTTRHQLLAALSHTCGPLTEFEDLTRTVPQSNLNTQWQLLPDEHWTEAYERLAGGPQGPLRS